MSWSKEFQACIKANTWEAQEAYNEYIQGYWEDIEQIRWMCHSFGGVDKPDKSVVGKYYVYVVMVPDSTVPVYVGYGSGGRHQHACSGASHSKALNKLYFTGAEMRTIIYEDRLTGEEAKKLEWAMIGYFNPHCNVFGHSNTMYNRGSGKRNMSPYDMLSEGLLKRP